MSRIIFDSGISLDGFFAGDNRSPGNPMGGVSPKIHNWMFKQKAFWKHIKLEGGEEYGADSKLIDDVFARTGSYIWGNECLKKAKSIGQKIYTKQMCMFSHTKNGNPGFKKGQQLFISSMTEYKVHWKKQDNQPKEKT